VFFAIGDASWQQRLTEHDRRCPIGCEADPLNQSRVAKGHNRVRQAFELESALSEIEALGFELNHGTTGHPAGGQATPRLVTQLPVMASDWGMRRRHLRTHP
jgi:hypothetical protein